MAGLPGEISLLLARIREGDHGAMGDLIPLVYGEMRALAGHFMGEERISHTLQPTALVHEAWLRLAPQDRVNWRNRAQFMAIAACMMRRVLVDHARERRAAKRSSPAVFDPGMLDRGLTAARLDEILAVDEALDRLCSLDRQQASVAEMRYFADLSVEEIAGALGVSPRTVKRDWAMARAWLHAELSGRSMR